MLKLFAAILSIAAILCLSVLHNFDNLTILFSDLYLAKFLDTSAKLFFPYKHRTCLTCKFSIYYTKFLIQFSFWKVLFIDPLIIRFNYPLANKMRKLFNRRLKIA